MKYWPLLLFLILLPSVSAVIIDNETFLHPSNSSSYYRVDSTVEVGNIILDQENLTINGTKYTIISNESTNFTIQYYKSPYTISEVSGLEEFNSSAGVTHYSFTYDDYYIVAPTGGSTPPGGGGGGGGGGDDINETKNITSFIIGGFEYIPPEKREIPISGSCYSNETKVILNNSAYCVICDGKIAILDGEIYCRICPEGTTFKNGVCYYDIAFNLRDFWNSKVRPLWEKNKVLFMFSFLLLVIIIIVSLKRIKEIRKKRKAKKHG